MKNRFIAPIFCAAILAGCAGEQSAVKNDVTPVPASVTAPVSTPAAEKKDAPAVSAAAPSAKVEEKAPAATDPVAKAGKTVITRGELDRALAVLIAQNRIQPGSSPDDMKKAQLSALDQLIYAELLYQEGLKAAPADLEKQVEFKMAQNKGKFGSPDEFESALKSSGMTEKDLAEISRKDIVITSYIETKIVPTLTVSDDEVKKFYDENRDRLGDEPQVKASHILIGVDATATPEVKAKAKEKAEAILKALKAGRDFAEAAKADSTCPSKEQGGDLGFFGRGQMVPEFENAAFGLKPGEMSGVVETQFGFHIIKLTDKKGGEIPKFEELKEKIATFLKGQKTQKSVFDFVNKLKSEAKVEVLL